LSQSYPGKLEEYYRLLEQLPEDQLERIVADLAGVNPAAVELPVGRFLPRFRRERFLFDYRDDERLLFRLNQVMSRVRLSALPDSMMGWLPSARKRVDELAPRLLCGFRWPLEMVV
ncbi:MAG: hypothetical protein ACK53V_09075, partial [Planctomycetota bacterium]